MRSLAESLFSKLLGIVVTAVFLVWGTAWIFGEELDFFEALIFLGFMSVGVWLASKLIFALGGPKPETA